MYVWLSNATPSQEVTTQRSGASPMFFACFMRLLRAGSIENPNAPSSDLVHGADEHHPALGGPCLGLRSSQDLLHSPTHVRHDCALQLLVWIRLGAYAGHARNDVLEQSRDA